MTTLKMFSYAAGLLLAGFLVLGIGITQVTHGWMGSNWYYRILCPAMCVPTSVFCIWFGFVGMRAMLLPAPLPSAVPTHDTPAELIPEDTLRDEIWDFKYDRLCRTLCGLAVMVGMLWLAALATMEIVHTNEVQHWARVIGTVQRMGTKPVTTRRRNTGALTHWVPHVEYTYTVDGQVFESEQLSFSPITSISRDKLKARLHQLCGKQGVTVWYDPEDPSVAVLIPGVDIEQYLVLAGLCVAAIGSLAFSLTNLRAFQQAEIIVEAELLAESEDDDDEMNAPPLPRDIWYA